MRKTILSRIMLAVVAVAAGILAGCDASESDDRSLQLVLLAALNSSPWSIVTPRNGSTRVSYVSDIVLRYNDGDLDPVIDDESIQITEEGGAIMEFNNGNSVITIDGDTVTVNPTLSTFPASGTLYYNMVISGFTDSALTAIDTFTFANFIIRSEPK